MRYILSVLMLIFSFGFTLQQEPEKKQVLMESIDVKYEGETKKGLAHGKGKAFGESDSYEGEFRKGYPHGEGTYTWGNGNKYTGQFSKGKKDGKGELIIKGTDNTVTIQTGYFRDNEYVGLYKDPYKIISDGGVRNVDFQKKASTLNQLSFEVYSNGVPVSSGILNIRDKNNTMVETIAGTKTLTNANFPLERVEVSFTVNKLSYTLIFDLYEKGNWNVVITI